MGLDQQGVGVNLILDHGPSQYNTLDKQVEIKQESADSTTFHLDQRRYLSHARYQGPHA
jgi:hypothetical protein